MSKMTGDLVQVGVVKEATRGTKKAPAYELRWGELEFNQKVMTALDESRTGILEDNRDVKVVGKFGEGSITAPLRDKSIGLFLLSLFGTSSSSSVSDSAYTHTITVQEAVQHQSLCFHKKDLNGGYDYALAMISSLELSVEPDKLAMFTANFRSKAGTNTLGTFTVTLATPGVFTLTAHTLASGDAVVLSTTGALPTGLVAGTTYYVYYVDVNTFNLCPTQADAIAGTNKIVTSGSQSGVHTATLVGRYLAATPTTEYVFLPQHCTFKTAATQATLTAANAINVRSLKLTTESEVEEDRSLGSTDPSDINNKGFSVKAEISYVRAADTYDTALLAGTAYALRIDLNNADQLLGTTSTPRLYFDIHKAILESADTDISKGDLAVQNLVFRASYKEGADDNAMVKAFLINTVATVT